MKAKLICVSLILSAILCGCSVGDNEAGKHTEYTTTPTMTFFSDDKAYGQSGNSAGQDNEFVSTFNELTDVYSNLVEVKGRVYEHGKITEEKAEEILKSISAFELKTEEMQKCIEDFIANYAENGVIYEDFMKTVKAYYEDFEKAERELEQLPKIDLAASEQLKMKYEEAKGEMNELMKAFEKAQADYLNSTKEQ